MLSKNKAHCDRQTDRQTLWSFTTPFTVHEVGLNTLSYHWATNLHRTFIHSVHSTWAGP